MKIKLLTAMALGAALVGCGAPAKNPLSMATFGQDATVQSTGYGVEASTYKPFYHAMNANFDLKDSDCQAQVYDGQATYVDQPGKVDLHVRGVDKLQKDGSWRTQGDLNFQDKAHKLHLQGKVDDKGVYLSEEMLYVHLEGALRDGNRFAVDINSLDPYHVSYTLTVIKPSDGSTLYQYYGQADKGHLSLSDH